jgi:hypothetical protein
MVEKARRYKCNDQENIQKRTEWGWAFYRYKHEKAKTKPHHAVAIRLGETMKIQKTDRTAFMR